mmetsp:Transcript_15000/g.44147  ORF Transcript_15000/g.44147 Transcript_15000/m.44147 type:complete len:91 (-) Transcript_15000:790-1062(-)
MRHGGLLAGFRTREEQGAVPRAWEHELDRAGCTSLALNGTKLLQRVHRQAVTWIDLESVENRCGWAVVVWGGDHTLVTPLLSGYVFFMKS